MAAVRHLEGAKQVLFAEQKAGFGIIRRVRSVADRLQSFEDGFGRRYSAGVGRSVAS